MVASVVTPNNSIQGTHYQLVRSFSLTPDFKR